MIDTKTIEQVKTLINNYDERTTIVSIGQITDEMTNGLLNYKNNLIYIEHNLVQMEKAIYIFK
jgi:hypothetical protein